MRYFSNYRDGLTWKWNQHYSTVQRVPMEGEALVESILSRRSHAFGTSQRITAMRGKARKKLSLSRDRLITENKIVFPITLCRLSLPPRPFIRSLSSFRSSRYPRASKQKAAVNLARYSLNPFRSPIHCPLAYARRPQWAGNNLKHG